MVFLRSMLLVLVVYLAQGALDEKILLDGLPTCVFPSNFNML